MPAEDRFHGLPVQRRWHQYDTPVIGQNFFIKKDISTDVTIINASFYDAHEQKEGGDTARQVFFCSQHGSTMEDTNGYF
jgi:hypothetical protein